MLTSYQQLTVWQKSIDLVVEIYRLTRLFPKEELYGITNQSRRAVVSIPSNIAEGYARKHRQEYAQFVRIAFASGAELETQLIVEKRLELASSKEFEKSEALLNEIMKILNALINTLVARLYLWQSYSTANNARKKSLLILRSNERRSKRKYGLASLRWAMMAPQARM